MLTKLLLVIYVTIFLLVYYNYSISTSITFSISIIKIVIVNGIPTTKTIKFIIPIMIIDEKYNIAVVNIIPNINIKK